MWKHVLTLMNAGHTRKIAVLAVRLALGIDTVDDVTFSDTFVIYRNNKAYMMYTLPLLTDEQVTIALRIGNILLG